MDNTTKFQPTVSQRIILKAFQTRNYLCSVEEACSVIEKFARSTYYDWFDHPDFTEWWQDQADEFFVKRLPKVKAAVLDAATKTFGRKAGKYNSKAQELFLQRFDKGFIPKTRKEVKHEGNIGVNFSKMQDDELERAERALRNKDDDGKPTDGRTTADADD